MGDAGEPQVRDHHVMARPPHPLGSHSPVYFYEFQHRPSFLKDIRPPHVKADHGDELLFVFGTLPWGANGECSWAGSLRDSSFPECGMGSLREDDCPHCTDEQTEAEREDGIRCPRSYS